MLGDQESAQNDSSMQEEEAQTEEQGTPPEKVGISTSFSTMCLVPDSDIIRTSTALAEAGMVCPIPSCGMPLPAGAVLCIQFVAAVPLVCCWLLRDSAQLAALIATIPSC